MLLIVFVILAAVGCGEDGGDDDPVATYCEAVSEYVQFAQDDPTNADLAGDLQDLEAESADLLRQAESDPGSVDEGRLTECGNRLRQIQPGG